MRIERAWAMPNSNTFSVKPIGDFVRRYVSTSEMSIDPFARDGEFATITNDLNPNTNAEYHLDALDFLFQCRGFSGFDLGIFDPPYSPRQLSECYQQVGRKATMADTQSKSWSDWKNALAPLIIVGGYVLSFGWNSVGMGKSRGFEIEEILMVCHGGMHNDTICLAERKIYEASQAAPSH